MRIPMITGHAGNDDTEINSLESLVKCISIGADAFEVDIRRDRRGVLVLSHHEQSQRAYAKCLRLSEVFRHARLHPSIRINCDLKDQDLPLEVISMARSFGIGPDRLILTGVVSPALLKKHPDIVDQAMIYLNAENMLEGIYFERAAIPRSPKSLHAFYQNPWKHLREVIDSADPYDGLMAETCQATGVRGLNAPYRVLSDDSIRFFRDNGVPLSVWTVNEQTEIVRFLSSGVENLTTLRVSLAKSIRKELYGQ